MADLVPPGRSFGRAAPTWTIGDLHVLKVHGRAAILGGMTMTTQRVGIPEEWWDNFEPPPGCRAEIIQGELVLTPSPGAPHAYAATNLMWALKPHLPAEWELVQTLEWRLPKGGIVATAPIPDLLVIPVGLDRLVDPPILAIEILSASDFANISTGITRIEAKRLDYAKNGLQHYLEIDLTTARAKTAARFELVKSELVRVDEVFNEGVLAAEVPFPYEICPSDL